MTAVNPEAPGSPTGPRLVVKAQKAEVAERMGKQIQTDPSPALKYEPSFKTLETSGEIGAQRVVMQLDPQLQQDGLGRSR